MTMTNLKIGIGALVIAGAATALVVQHQTQTILREENDSLQQQTTQLHSENTRLSNLVAQADSFQSQAGDQQTELLHLRDEVTRLRTDSRELAQWKIASAQRTNDPMDAAAKELLSKMNLLKERLRQNPGWSIPELQILPDTRWANAALNAKLDSDEDVRQALCGLRNSAKQWVNQGISQALAKYIQANNGELPTSASQVAPYFAWVNIPFPNPNPSVVDAILQRYQMLKTGNVSDLQPSDMLVAEKAPVDDKYDVLFEIGLAGAKSHGIGERSGESGMSTWAPWQPPDNK
jgi:myosin heavy subunit